MRANDDYGVTASRQCANHIWQFLALDGLFAQTLAVAACFHEYLFQTVFAVGVFPGESAKPALDEFLLELNETNGMFLGEANPWVSSHEQTAEQTESNNQYYKPRPEFVVDCQSEAPVCG